MKIFVQIASYRDPQLIPTIKNMLENAKRPKNLRIGVARQFHPDDKFDDLSEFENDSRFRILNIPHEEAEGVCWARNLVQQLYNEMRKRTSAAKSDFVNNMTKEIDKDEFKITFNCGSDEYTDRKWNGLFRGIDFSKFNIEKEITKNYGNITIIKLTLKPEFRD
jgi:hypothetical protein